MEYCRRKEQIPFFRLNKENAEDCLNAMGFGIKKCEETRDKDGRYGIVTDNSIKFGFENHMRAEWKFGKYIVKDEDGSWEELHEEYFNENYEVI